jgi:hypothetical protein
MFEGYGGLDARSCATFGGTYRVDRAGLGQARVELGRELTVIQEPDETGVGLPLDLKYAFQVQ